MARRNWREPRGRPSSNIRSSNYASQKNWGLEHAGLTAPWVFILDADERITPELRDEVLGKIGKGPEVGYYVNRLLIFMGQTVRHGGLYPSWNLRLFKPWHARYELRSPRTRCL